MGTRNEACREAPFRERRIGVLFRVEHDRRAGDLAREVADVAREARHEPARRVLAERGGAQRLVEPCLLRGAALRDERRRDRMAHDGIGHVPAALDLPHQGVDRRALPRRDVALEPSAHVGGMQHEMADARGEARREGDREGRAAEPGEHREPLQAERLGDGAHVANHGPDRVILDAAIGKSEAARVEADQRMAARQLREPVSEDGAIEIALEVTVAAGQHQQRRPVADDGIGDANSVGRIAEADALTEVHHRAAGYTIRGSRRRGRRGASARRAGA